MNQDGTFSSIYGLCITGFLTIASHVANIVAPYLTIVWQIKLTDVLTVCAIIAAISTIAVNVKNFLKKDKNK